MKAVYKEPGMAPEIIDVGNSLTALQHMVHGYIKTVTISGNIRLICNEEGRINGMPFNLSILARDRLVQIFGPLLLVGTDMDDFCDLPEPEWWLEQIGGAANG